MKIMFRCRILLLVSFILTLFSSCFTIKPVEFKKAENITTSRTDSDFVMTLELAMYNPNNWSIRLSEVETDILIDNMQLGKANLSKSVRLTRNSNFILPVHAKASLTDLIKLSGLGLNLWLGNQTATATIKGSMTLKKFIFRRKVQFEYKEKIDNKVIQSWF